jgi:predicted transcriptional regulator
MKKPLEKLFSSKTRIKMLTLFLKNPNEKYYVRQLTRKLNERINSIRRELDNLSKIGLLKSEKKDLKKYYYIDKKFELLSELKALFIKAMAAPKDEIIAKLNKVGNIKYACLTGSFTKSPAKVDLLVVGDVKKPKLLGFIKELEKIQGHDIDYTVMDENEFKYRNDLGDQFLLSILNNQTINLIGTM